MKHKYTRPKEIFPGNKIDRLLIINKVNKPCKDYNYYECKLFTRLFYFDL